MGSQTFYIYNYLLYPIEIISIDGDFVLNIEAQNKKFIQRMMIEKYFKNKRKLRINILGLSSGPIWFSDYILNLPENKIIKALHIGMTTSKSTGDSSEISTGWSAVQGVPFVSLYNQTGKHLYLNHNIIIPPYSFINYSGFDKFGVRLGTIFTDKEGIFPSFKLLAPATDIYFGVISDLQQPLYGGWQLTTDLDVSLQEPHHLLEHGFMGGPIQRRIIPGILPIEGLAVPKLDKWGRKYKKEKQYTDKEKLDYIYKNQSRIMKELSGIDPNYKAIKTPEPRWW